MQSVGFQIQDTKIDRPHVQVHLVAVGVLQKHCETVCGLTSLPVGLVRPFLLHCQSLALFEQHACRCEVAC